MRIRDLYNRIASVCHLKVPTRPISDLENDRNHRQLYYFMLDCVNDILQKKDFPATESIAYYPDTMIHLGYIDRHNNLVPIGAAPPGEPIPVPDNAIGTRFKLPSDYLRPVRSGSYYNETDYLMGVPVSKPVGWQNWIDWGYTYGDRFRVDEHARTLDTIPPLVFTPQRNGPHLPDSEIQFNYISRNWLIANNGTRSAEITDDNQETILDHELIYYGTCFRFFHYKGWDYQLFMDNYNSKLEAKLSDSKVDSTLIIGSDGLKNAGPLWNRDYNIALPYRITEANDA